MGDGHVTSVMAVVPMKPLGEAKARLALALEASARAQLSRDLLVRTLIVLGQADGISRTAVISRDMQVLKIARQNGAWAMYETGRGLNAALEQATRVAEANGVKSLLIVPADLPNLTEGDVEAMIGLAIKPPCVVIAPDRREQGTNALLVSPPGLIPYAFGENSCAEHQRLARAAGRLELYRSNGTAFDLDVPEDVRALGPLDIGGVWH